MADKDPPGVSRIKALHAERKQRVYDNYVFIKSNLPMTVITPLLLQNHIITPIHKGILDAKCAPDKADYFMDHILLKMDIDKYEKFIQIMYAENEDIARILDGSADMSSPSGDHQTRRRGKSPTQAETQKPLITRTLKGQVLEYMRDITNITIHWKQDSFFGLGGDRSQNYNVCEYFMTGWSMNVQVFIANGWEKPKKLKVDKRLRYGINDGTFFFVLDDHSNSPYQARFTQNAYQKASYSASNMQMMGFALPKLDWLIGKYLNTID